jgi:Asp-tRNA(Asn)/Glu-tRNA(Gln) amidotransferase A subunit family amidase
MAVEALRKAGHQVVEFTVPDAFETMHIYFGLFSTDGNKADMAPLAGDPLINQIKTIKQMVEMPYFICILLAWVMRYFYKDNERAAVLLSLVEKTHAEVRSYACRRNAYRNLFAKTVRAVALEECGQTFDAIIAPGFGFSAALPEAIDDIFLMTSYTSKCLGCANWHDASNQSRS